MSEGVLVAALTFVVGPVLVVVVGALATRGTTRAAQGAQQRAQSPVPVELSDRDRATIDGLVTTVGHLSERVEHLEADLAQRSRDLATALAYIRRLLDWISAATPERADVPAPPASLQDHIDT